MMNPTFNSSSALTNNLALLQSLLASNLSNISSSLQQNRSQLLNQPGPSPTQASVANNRKDKSFLSKRKLPNLGLSVGDSPEKKIVTNSKEAVTKQPNLDPQSLMRQIRGQNQGLMPQSSQMQIPTSNLAMLRNMNQLYQLLQLNAMLRNKNSGNMGLNPRTPGFQPTTNQNKLSNHPNDITLKIEDQQMNQERKPLRADLPTQQATDFSEESMNDTDRYSTTPSENQGPRTPISEPALVEFTREFPDWGLSDIFTYISTGQPKKDFTPSRKSTRPVIKSTSHEQEKTNVSMEEEALLARDCREEIKALLEMEEVNEAKVKLMLKKNEMKPERVLGTVKKNLPFYKKYFTVKK